jgi:carboxylate-amine ligase
VQYPCRRELIFGLHVHVGVPDPESAMKAIRLLRSQIGVLIALFASCPFGRGFASGLYSTRHGVFATFPRSGMPPAFRDYGEFATFVAALERSRVIDDYTRIWWDLRPTHAWGRSRCARWTRSSG